ncbi:50S ribosomal protein L23 [bacterium]|nr:MAG: 50S ribosomal protein L23 [bacterium]
MAKANQVKKTGAVDIDKGSEFLKPIINEKSILLAKDGIYSFVVTKKESSKSRSNKIIVGKEIANLYKVKVVDIRSVSIRGKKKRIGNTRNFRITDSKKRYLVKLAKGDSIEGFAI